MNCSYCASATAKEQPCKTALSYRKFRCSACKCLFNERTGTPFNFLEYPTDVVLLVVLWRLRYKLSLRDLAEMLAKLAIPVPNPAFLKQTSPTRPRHPIFPLHRKFTTKPHYYP